MNVRRWEGSNPGATCSSRSKLRTRSPAATSTTTDTATSATTSPPRSRRAPAVPVPPRPPSFNLLASETRETWSAGAGPKRSVVRRLIPRLKRSTTPSTRTLVRRGMLEGAKRRRAGIAQAAARRPSPPPASERVTLSASRWRAIRQRLAPSADRTATSRACVVMRASVRFARFAQTIRSTSPAVARSTRSARRMSPTRASESGRKRISIPAFVAGYSFCRRRERTRASSRARSGATPAFTCATARKIRRERLAACCGASASESSNGTQSWKSALGNSNSGGMTPMTV